LKAGAAEDAHEDGLRLVIGMVRHDDAVGFLGAEHGREGVKTGLAGGVFTGAGGEAEAFKGKGEFEFFGELGDEFGVGGAFGAADAVVDVGDDEVPLPVIGAADFIEEAKEGDRVGTAADGDEEAGFLRQETTFVQSLVDLLN
jgi:hypothetical protein